MPCASLWRKKSCRTGKANQPANPISAQGLSLTRHHTGVLCPDQIASDTLSDPIRTSSADASQMGLPFPERCFEMLNSERKKSISWLINAIGKAKKIQ